MARYVVRRVLMMVPTLIFISMVSFVVMELPPGNLLTSWLAGQAESGEMSEGEVENMRRFFALDQPQYVRYLRWVKNLARGHLGYSIEYRGKPVNELIAMRLPLTATVTLSSLLIVWAIAFPVGIYSATRQYSLEDYLFTAISFTGRGIPDFLLALVLLYAVFKLFNYNATGLFSREFHEAPWSWAKLLDLLKHLWLPVLVIAMGSTTGLIRTMRANMLDELHKPYVTTARAKGLNERRLTLKYPVRVALIPFASTVGWTLPALVSGTSIVSIVLGLQTLGPLALRAWLAQDVYLGGALLLLESTLTVVGTFLSDILLAWLDPRIRLV
jgi:peptide/nickel transport system permease protein